MRMFTETSRKYASVSMVWGSKRNRALRLAGRTVPGEKLLQNFQGLRGAGGGMTAPRTVQPLPHSFSFAVFARFRVLKLRLYFGEFAI